MAGVLNTGKFDPNNGDKTGAAYSYSVPSYSYCQESSASVATYPNPTETESGVVAVNAETHSFGFKCQNILIHNEGAADIAVSFSVLWGRGGATKDSAIIKANSTLQLRDAQSIGVKVRQRAAGAALNYIIQAW